jgi:hypothetical protein
VLYAQVVEASIRHAQTSGKGSAVYADTVLRKAQLLLEVRPSVGSVLQPTPESSIQSTDSSSSKLDSNINSSSSSSSSTSGTAVSCTVGSISHTALIAAVSEFLCDTRPCSLSTLRKLLARNSVRAAFRGAGVRSLQLLLAGTSDNKDSSSSSGPLRSACAANAALQYFAPSMQGLTEPSYLAHHTAKLAAKSSSNSSSAVPSYAVTAMRAGSYCYYTDGTNGSCNDLRLALMRAVCDLYAEAVRRLQCATAAGDADAQMVLLQTLALCTRPADHLMLASVQAVPLLTTVLTTARHSLAATTAAAASEDVDAELQAPTVATLRTAALQRVVSVAQRELEMLSLSVSTGIYALKQLTSVSAECAQCSSTLLQAFSAALYAELSTALRSIASSSSSSSSGAESAIVVAQSSSSSSAQSSDADAVASHGTSVVQQLYRCYRTITGCCVAAEFLQLLQDRAWLSLLIGGITITRGLPVLQRRLLRQLLRTVLQSVDPAALKLDCSKCAEDLLAAAESSDSSAVASAASSGTSSPESSDTVPTLGDTLVPLLLDAISGCVVPPDVTALWAAVQADAATTTAATTAATDDDVTDDEQKLGLHSKQSTAAVEAVAATSNRPFTEPLAIEAVGLLRFLHSRSSAWASCINAGLVRAAADTGDLLQQDILSEHCAPAAANTAVRTACLPALAAMAVLGGFFDELHTGGGITLRPASSIESLALRMSTHSDGIIVHIDRAKGVAEVALVDRGALSVSATATATTAVVTAGSSGQQQQQRRPAVNSSASANGTAANTHIRAVKVGCQDLIPMSEVSF